LPGTLTFAQLNVEVRAGVGNRVDAALTDARVANALNLGQQRISRLYNFTETNSVWVLTPAPFVGAPATDKWLSLPTGVKVIHSLILQDSANSRKLIEKPWRQFDRNIPLVEYIAPEWPRFYTRFGVNIIELFPAPQSAYNYFGRFTMLPSPFDGVTQAQVSDFIDKDDIIIDLAVAYFMRTHGRPDLADEREAQAKIRLDEMKSTVEDRPDMDVSADNMGFGPGAAGQYWANAFVSSTED